MSQLVGGATNIYWEQARDVAIYSTMHGRFPAPLPTTDQPHSTKNYLTPIIESDEVGKSRFRVILLGIFVSEKNFQIATAFGQGYIMS